MTRKKTSLNNLNVLFLNTGTIDPNKGGIQRVTYALGQSFSNIGINVHYLSIKRTDESYFKEQFFLPNQNDLFCKENEDFTIDFVVERKIQIVIFQGAIAPKYFKIALWTKKTNAKLISTIHSPLCSIYGLANHFTVLRNTKFSQKIDKVILSLFRLKYLTEYSDLFNKSDRIVVLSNKLVQDVEVFTKTKRFSEKLRAISNPLTTKILLARKEKEIITVGRLEKTKRIDLLLDIWNLIYKKYPDWKLTIVGEGTERKKLEQQAINLNLQKISFEGFKSPEAYYARSSIFCLTSALEGFGLVLVESMANGVVPLAFNSYVNASEIIDNNINGFLIPPFSIEEYANRLSELIENEKKREIMSKEALTKSKEFNIESIREQWIDLFNELIISPMFL